MNTANPEVEKALINNQPYVQENYISNLRNQKGIEKTINEKDAAIDDYYAKRDYQKIDALDKAEYEQVQEKLTAEDLALLNSNKQFYELKFSNLGGLVSPIIVQAKFEDGTHQDIYIPAEIWRMDDVTLSKVFVFDQKVTSFRLDPYLETADCDLDNNSWPVVVQPTRFQLFNQQKMNENPMQRQKRVEELEKKEE